MIKYKDIERFTPHGNYEVNVSLNYLEEHIQSQMEKGCGAAFDMDPDFQRAHVWNDQQRIRFVEYLLRGGRSGLIIYTNCAGWQSDYRGPYVLVDGKQRLTACLKFVRNELPIFGGNYFKDFDKIPHDVGLRWHVNDLKTRKEVLRWYLDLNSGGVVHTEEELDKVRELLKKEK